VWRCVQVDLQSWTRQPGVTAIGTRPYCYDRKGGGVTALSGEMTAPGRPRHMADGSTGKYGMLPPQCEQGAGIACCTLSGVSWPMRSQGLR
jgi:hypothetical protein